MLCISSVGCHKVQQENDPSFSTKKLTVTLMGTKVMKDSSEAQLGTGAGKYATFSIEDSPREGFCSSPCGGLGGHLATLAKTR